MKIEGKGNTPNHVKQDPFDIRSSMVVTPGLVDSLKAMIPKVEQQKRKYTQEVRGYSSEAHKKVTLLRGGGKSNTGTRAATLAARVFEKSGAGSPRNPIAVLHPKRVKRG